MMFDFIFTFGEYELKEDIYEKTLNIFKHKKYNIYQNKYNMFTFVGLSHENESHSVFENNDYMIAIIGKVFYNSSYSDTLGTIGAEDILALYLTSDNILLKVKGEFAIVIHKKKMNEIEVINDHFGLKPIYYGMKDDNYFVSNNLNLFREIQFELNQNAVLEKLIFTYPIGDHTLLKDVNELKGGDVLTINEQNKYVKSNFSLHKMIFRPKVKKFSHKKLTDLLNHSVAQRAYDNDPCICSLTGGFDGRTVISSLLKQKIDFFTYSFGKKNGENTEVPLNVSKNLGIDYRPIYLEKEYERNYYKFGIEAIYASDGLSSFDRSNYSFAFNKLSEHSNTILSGLVAGEILRPIHLKCDYFNELYYDLIYLGKSFNLGEYIKDSGLEQFINRDWALSLNEKINDSIEQRQELINKLRNNKNGYLFYLYDLISLGFRKFYGNEMHLERFYADNLSPFFDYEIIEYLFNTTYISIFKNAFKKSLLARWKGQMVYANIINNNYSSLGKIPVDRGYPPSYLLNPLKRLLIPKLYLDRKKGLESKPTDFNSPEWNKIFYTSLKQNIVLEESKILNINGLMKFVNSYSIEKFSRGSNGIISLCLWLENFK